MIQKKENKRTLMAMVCLAFLSPASSKNICLNEKLGDVKIWSGNPLSKADPKMRPIAGQTVEDPDLMTLKEGSSFVSPRFAGPINNYTDPKTNHKYLITSDDRYMWAVSLESESPEYKTLTSIIGHAEKSFVQFGKCGQSSGASARFIGSPYVSQMKDEKGQLLDSLLVVDPYGNFIGELKHPLDQEKCELTPLAGNNKQGSIVVNGRPPHRGNAAGVNETSAKVCGTDAMFWNPMFIVADAKDKLNEKYFFFDRQGMQSTTSELKVINSKTGCVDRVAKNFPRCNVTSMVYNEKSESLFFACNASNGTSKILKVDPYKEDSPTVVFEGGTKFWTQTSKQPILQEMVSLPESDKILISGNGFIYSFDVSNKTQYSDPVVIAGAGIEASNRYSRFMQAYDFYDVKPAAEVALPFNQGDGPVYMSLFSRFAALPDNDSLLYCGRYKNQNSCWEIDCN